MLTCSCYVFSAHFVNKSFSDGEQGSEMLSWPQRRMWALLTLRGPGRVPGTLSKASSTCPLRRKWSFPLQLRTWWAWVDNAMSWQWMPMFIKVSPLTPRYFWLKRNQSLKYFKNYWFTGTPKLLEDLWKIFRNGEAEPSTRRQVCIIYL